MHVFLFFFLVDDASFTLLGSKQSSWMACMFGWLKQEERGEGVTPECSASKCLLCACASAVQGSPVNRRRRRSTVQMVGKELLCNTQERSWQNMIYSCRTDKWIIFLYAQMYLFIFQLAMKCCGLPFGVHACVLGWWPRINLRPHCCCVYLGWLISAWSYPPPQTKANFVRDEN